MQIEKTVKIKILIGRDELMDLIKSYIANNTAHATKELDHAKITFWANATKEVDPPAVMVKYDIYTEEGGDED